jgi:Zn-dependent protease
MIGKASLRLGKIGPIEVSVNITWLAIFGLLVYWLRVGYIAESAPDLGGIRAWLVSLLGALLLFVSVLAHELSHSLVAIRDGLSIRRITLFIFGGVAHMESEPQSPGIEFRMAIAGPAASLVIAGLCALARSAVLLGAGECTASLILEYAFLANLALACFNLVPGFPLDGGRVLRAALWRLTGDFLRSTLIASAVGRVFGLFMVFAGVALAVGTDMLAFLWPALVGTFLERLAYLSAQRAKTTHGPSAARPFRTTATPLPTFYSTRNDPPESR